MNIDDRIERRLDGEPGTGVFVDFDAVSPVSHVDSPVGRGPMIERLLDAFQPALSGSAPPTVYVHGPKGGGKSAVVAALFERLAARGGPRRAIQTTTRAVEPAVPGFAYVDARRASTRFRLYRALLSATTDEPVPGRGVGTDELTETLRGAVRTDPDLVVAVDHVGEPETPSPAALREWLADAGEGLVPACIGRDPPDAVDWEPDATVEFATYRRHVLVEVLTSRCSTGLGRDALSHAQIRDIVEWAAGDAHDALAAVTGAAVSADRAGASTVRPTDVDAGIDAVSRPCVALGRVLALAESRRRILYELAALPDEARATVSAATEAVAARPDVDLSPSTVRRVLYELSDAGFIRRETVRRGGKGRPPSRVVPRFPTTAFRELFDRDARST